MTAAVGDLAGARLPRAPRLGLKGPRAEDWLTGQGITVPPAPNSWTWSEDGTARSAQVLVAPTQWLVARLGTGEFFLEAADAAHTLWSLPSAAPAGVYTVPREDAAFALDGPRAGDVLLQVCSFNFAGLDLGARPVVMTLMLGVSVLVVPQASSEWRRYLIWCDPTFGEYVGESLRTVVTECGGIFSGAMP